MREDIREARWFDVRTAAEHANLKQFGRPEPPTGIRVPARVQMGTWTGPGRYFVLSYTQRCPRNCCDDSVFEVIAACDVAQMVREVIREYAAVLREAKRPIAVADGPT